MQQSIDGDVLDAAALGADPDLDLSVVCPFYNEEQIIGSAVESLLAHLDKFEGRWELIVVDDGSKDRSAEIVATMAQKHPHLRLLSYRFNRGRGHGLRTGIEQARGAVIVTTEIDLSWGDDIVERLYAAALAHPDTDIIVASPHMQGGSYKNVPARRVFYSKLGNHVIRTLMTSAVTMNTGMTRAYRRTSIQSLPLEENGKEFHLEVILKAEALGYRIHEIPAVLEWKEYKLQGQRVERKSSSKVNKLILSHSLFSIFGNPVRYVWMFGGLSFLLSAGFLVAGIVRYWMGLVSVYMGILSLALFMLGVMLFAFGVIAQQSNMIQRELWRMKRDQKIAALAARRDSAERRAHSASGSEIH